jgi:hypothetical protein
MTNKTTEINKNVYYIGDLAHVMTNEWEEICDNITRADEDEIVFSLEDGRDYILMNTAFGDGTYNDLNGQPYSVDSGTIGAILVNNITDTEALNQALSNGLGHLYQSDEELDHYNCSYFEGTIYIGQITIDTNDYGYDDNEELDILTEDEILAIVA